MCGRFVVARATAELVPLFGIDEAGDDLPGPSYNIAPTQRIGIVVDRPSHAATIEVATSKDSTADDTSAPVARHLVAARWGLVPSYATSLAAGPTPFNARSEKLTTSGMYRRAFAARRAIVPADGFYERRRIGDRQSFYIHPADGSVLALAGLYEWWRVPGAPDDDPARWLLSATIITRTPQGAMTAVHDREPLYLRPDLWDEWLDPAARGDADLLGAVMAASTDVAAALDLRPIGPAWGTTVPGQRRDDPGLIAS
ncbi:MAG: SOS response-associated peptidase [Actinomycetia bacterium]|nr:SOS response-associated peptidase [Actinomycetes bacterium]